jgi:pyridoxine 5'-phosphate synthase PdxJ
MPRIAKTEVNKALSVAAKTIVQAGGTDGRTSRAELKAKLSSLPKEQAALVDIFFKFIDNRDFKKGAQVTAKDVDRAVAYAKTHMIAKYDLNANGLSKDEIAKMSLTGKRAVELAKALKATGVPADGGTLSSTKLVAEFNKVAKDTNYMSESDSSAQPLSVAFAAGHDLTPHNVQTAMKDLLTPFFDNRHAAIAGEVYSTADANRFMARLKSEGDGEPSEVKSAKAFGTMLTLTKENLKDVKVFNFGPKAADGSVAGDQGLYARVVVGRAADGKLVGFLVGAVET